MAESKSRKNLTTAQIQAAAGSTGAVIAGRVQHDDFDTSLIEPDIAFVVYGMPAPQGSKKLVGRNRFVEANPGLEPWRKAIREQAKLAVIHKGDDWNGPINEEVFIKVVFTFPHSAASKKRGDMFHSIAPDLDKLQRAVGDALSPIPLKRGTGKGLAPKALEELKTKLKAEAAEYCVLADDKFIIGWEARKVYNGTTTDSLKFPGVAIEVWSAQRLLNAKDEFDD